MSPTSSTRFYRAARQLIPEDWPAADAEDLHELRKRVVIHRYQMDIVEPLWPRFARMWTGEAQRLRDRLGKHQDLLMLESLTGPHQPLARWRSRLAPAIAAAPGRACRGAARIAGAAVRREAERVPPAARRMWQARALLTQRS